MKILLIDSDDNLNLYHEELLKPMIGNDECISKPSGSQALQFLDQLIESNKPLPDFIFLDVNLPVMDGRAFLFEYESYPDWVHQHCKVIGMTAFTLQADVNRFVNNPFVTAYTQKPLSSAFISQYI